MNELRRCITWEVEGIRQRGYPKKSWRDCVNNDMESLGLSQKDVQSRIKWIRRIKGDSSAHHLTPKLIQIEISV